MNSFGCSQKLYPPANLAWIEKFPPQPEQTDHLSERMPLKRAIDNP
jgi:hypothetical protein